METKDLGNQFDSLKTMIIEHSLRGLPEPLAKAVASAIQEYNDLLKTTLGTIQKNLDAMREENDILRGLLAIAPDTFKAKCFEQAQEINFMRHQLIDLENESAAIRKEKDDFLLEREKLKNDIIAITNKGEVGFNKYEGGLSDMKKNLDKLTSTTVEKQRALDDEKMRLNLELMKEKDRVPESVDAELRKIISRLHELCGIVMLSSQILKDNWVKINGDMPAEEKESTAARFIADNFNDIELIFKNSSEMIKHVDAYEKFMPRDDSRKRILKSK